MAIRGIEAAPEGYAYTLTDPGQLVLLDRPRHRPFTENVGYRGMPPVYIEVLFESDVYRDRDLWVVGQYILGTHRYLGRPHRGRRGDETFAVRAFSFSPGEELVDHHWLFEKTDLIRVMPKRNPLEPQYMDLLFPKLSVPRFEHRIEDGAFGPRLVTETKYD